MAEEEQASLAEILAAANEGGIPVVIDGHDVHSIEDVPEEIRDLPTDNEARVAPAETMPEWLGNRDVAYVIGEEHQPLSRAILAEPDQAYYEDGKPIPIPHPMDQVLINTPGRINKLSDEDRRKLSMIKPNDGPIIDMRHRETDAEPTKQRKGDQILPTASRNLPVAHEEVIEDLQERLRIGIERYGQGLRPFTGRNTLQDLLEEMLDLVVYMKTLRLMQDATREVLIDQVLQVLRGWTEDPNEIWMASRLAAAVVDKVLDCFTGLEAQAPDAG